MPLSRLPDGPLPPSQETQAHHAIWELLESVTDPEIPVVNLREMGILRAVRQGPRGLEVVITPTYSGCPAMSQMADDVVNALSSAGVSASVITQLAPCAAAVGAQVVAFAPRKGLAVRDAVDCPQCGSNNTTEISHFGSTACKALYRCLDCMEPFDYFKPY